MNTLLIVDDEKSVRYSFKRIFENYYNVITAEDGKVALRVLDDNINNIDVIFLDVRMPGLNGIELLKKIKEKIKNIPVIIMTAFTDTNAAIEAMKEGAFDYLLKPLRNEQLREVVEKAISSSRLTQEAILYSEEEGLSKNVEMIVGKSQAILDVCKMIGQAAVADVPVLLSGESGVGKELVTRAIYNYSKRKGRHFMAVNCAALPDGIVESELFGSEKGAFTGAERMRIGRFEQCDNGTILLDEIGDLPLTTQAKLLRVLQDGSFERLGSNKTFKTDVRIISASNKDLHDEVRHGRFRKDLFHRLNVFTIHIPPLRERKEDIHVLSEYFVSRAEKETEKHIKGISPEALKLLMSHNWPGNVRELENVLRRAAATANADIIGSGDIHITTEHDIDEMYELAGLMRSIMDRAITAETTDGIFHCVISSAEKILIEEALRRTKGNRFQTSELLGISRVTLRKKMRDYNISSG
ncbi:MAG TPA: sigma-54-dependent Fis family transcriptional regulator [Nitrospirae bacterium]|nr:sigma-54-dependent Fis family transcriptional regulator [Nitrospirota bacterium]